MWRTRSVVSILMALWLALLVPVLFLAATPTATIVQGLLALTVLAILFALKPFVQKSLRVRFFVLAAASTLVLRYWFWRLTETLPSPDDPVSFIAALVLFGAESFTVVLFFLTALITADPTTPPLPKRMRRSEAPTVDVLVPSYNEPPELLAVTLAAAMQMVYPEGRKTVVLCDDGGTDQKCASPDPKAAKEAQERRAQLQAMCEQMGVVYTTRARNEHAKAGNLNSALHKLRGELVLILDADHVPSREFLARTAGYFVENPKLFLVQTPHFFTNRDPIERNIGLPETCPSENEMFYTEIHRGLDRLGGAFFCGSAALIRRKALDDVGGISGRTITEDAETALDIHSRGWESLYLDHAMIAGLQPETFASFITQRGRWATGMMQMLILKNPLFRPGLTMLQRVCYLNSMSYWLFPLVRMIFLLSPLFYLFFGLEVFVVTYDEVLAYILPHLLVGFLIQNALFSKVRWPLISEVYEIAQTPYLLKAVFNTVLRPNAATFKVTAKDETLDKDFISPVFQPLLMLNLLLFAGLVAAAMRWSLFPGDRTVVLIVGGWNLYNFLLAALSLRSVFERQRRLQKPRTVIRAPARVWLAGRPEETAAPALVRSISGKGLRLELQLGPDTDPALLEIKPDAEIMVHLEIPKARALEQTLQGKVTQSDRGRMGAERHGLAVTFDESQMIAASAMTAWLVYGDSKKWHAARKAVPQRRGLVPGILFVPRKVIVSLPVTVIELLQAPSAARTAKTDDRRSSVEQQAIDRFLVDDPTDEDANGYFDSENMEVRP